MTWLKEIFGLEQNLDAVAHTRLAELILDLEKLNKNFQLLKESLKRIEDIKKAGRNPNPSERKEFFTILSKVKTEIYRALELEQEIDKSEETQLQREKKSR